MLYWINDVQGYSDSSNWNYANELDKDTTSIFNSPDGNKSKSLVNATSGLVNRGCPELSCPGSELSMKQVSV